MNKIITILLLVLFSLTSYAERPLKIILLAGQSNMAGAGNFEALSTSDKARVTAAAKRVSLCDNNKSAKPLSHSYSKYQEEKRGYGKVFGPEIFIGVTLAEQYLENEFLILKRAEGGTSLYGAWHPKWTEERGRVGENKVRKQKMQLVKEHMAIIDANLEQLEAEGRSYEIIGMAWMQGENDAAREVRAREYEENLIDLIKTYRTTYKCKDMPFVMGQINSRYGNFPEGPEMVRQAYINVVKRVKNTAVIETSTDTTWSDFPKTSDNVHYNHEGQMLLGTAMGEALLKF